MDFKNLPYWFNLQKNISTTSLTGLSKYSNKSFKCLFYHEQYLIKKYRPWYYTYFSQTLALNSDFGILIRVVKIYKFQDTKVFFDKTTALRKVINFQDID